MYERIKTGPSLNAMICEEILGWENCGYKGGRSGAGRMRGKRPDGMFDTVPNYSTDFNETLKLLKEVNKTVSILVSHNKCDVSMEDEIAQCRYDELASIVCRLILTIANKADLEASKEV